MKNLIFTFALAFCLFIAACGDSPVSPVVTPPVLTQADSTVLPVDPVDGISYPENTNFTITWNQCLSAFKYELQFDSDSNFTAPSTTFINNGDTTLLSSSGTCSNSCTYYYHIRAYFPPNVTSDRYWSHTKRFTTLH